MDDLPQTPKAERPAIESAPVVNVAEAMRALQKSGLGAGSQRITELILDRPQDVVGMTLSMFAKEAEASGPLVVKVIQQAGLTGFQQLKLALARNLGSPTLPIHEDLAIGDDYRTITRKIFSASIQALVDTEEVLTPEALEAAVEILDAATVIDIYGIGSAAPIVDCPR